MNTQNAFFHFQTDTISCHSAVTLPPHSQQQYIINHTVARPHGAVVMTSAPHGAVVVTSAPAAVHHSNRHDCLRYISLLLHMYNAYNKQKHYHVATNILDT